MGSVKVVTGFIPLPGHPRPVAEFETLGLQLVQGLQAAGFPVHVGTGTVERTALREFVDARTTPKVADNPAKNTVEYHCVQHQKFLFLYEAYQNTAVQPDNYVWIDYGILHVPGVTLDVIRAYLNRVKEDPNMDISLPGCWPDEPREQIMAALDGENPVWRFCGGLMKVPTLHLPKFCVSAVTLAAYQMRTTRRSEWEVNTLCRLEQLDLVPIHWYQADHNQTMFTEGP
jgi:hypothetical protein